MEASTVRLSRISVGTRVALALLALALLLPVLLAPAAVLADDPLDRLNADEKAYVARVRQAYARARSETAALEAKVDAAVGSAVSSAVGGALDKFFGGPPTTSTQPQGPGTAEILSALAACNLYLDGTAATLEEAPPEGFQELSGTNAAVAAILRASLRPCNALVVQEGANRALQWGRNMLSSLTGAQPQEAGTSTATKAKIAGCVSKECANIFAALDMGEAALNAQIEGVQLERKKEEEEFLFDFIFEPCFIATAAYGTSSAAEIDILRDFRDGVLLASPAGRDYVGFYYAVSPPIADFIARHEWLRTLVREAVIDPIVDVAEWTGTYWSTT
jgi:hypothetical protein